MSKIGIASGRHSKSDEENAVISKNSEDLGKETNMGAVIQSRAILYVS